MAYSAAADHHDDHGHKQSFFERWFFSTNHKDIGTLYLIFSFVMFIIGAGMSVVIRAELMTPGLQFVKPEFFNQMTSVHALVMIFGGIMPAFVGLANWMIPLQVGAPDMALPRMNNWSFWILPFAFTLLLLTLFLPGGAPAGGWTLYPPLSLQGGYNLAFTSRLDRESDRIRQSGEHPTHEANPHYLLEVDNRLVLPVDTKVRFVITADDVIHSWWVPALGWKQDAIPGLINEAWTDIKVPGVYRGQCAELCGKDHGFMPIVVEALSKEDFARWLAAKKPAPAPAVEAAPAVEPEPAPADEAAPEATPADAVAQG